MEILYSLGGTYEWYLQYLELTSIILIGQKNTNQMSEDSKKLLALAQDTIEKNEVWAVESKENLVECRERMSEKLAGLIDELRKYVKESDVNPILVSVSIDTNDNLKRNPSVPVEMRDDLFAGHLTYRIEKYRYDHEYRIKMQSEHPTLDVKSATWAQLQKIEFNSSISKALNSSYLKSLEKTHEQRQQEMKEKKTFDEIRNQKILDSFHQNIDKEFQSEK